MKKTDSISPFEKGEKTNTSTLPCVTVRLPLVIVPHPLPGLSFTAFGRKGVGGCETGLARWTACGPPVLTRAPKHDHNNRKGVRNDRSSTPTCGKTVHYTSCMQRKKATHQPNTPNPDRDQTNQDQPPPNQRTTTTTTTKKQKKKQEREPDLAKGAEHEVRVELVVRVQDEETQGETQTRKRGLGFPST